MSSEPHDDYGLGLFLDLRKEGYAQWDVDIYGVSVTRKGSYWLGLVRAVQSGQYVCAFCYGTGYEDTFQRIGEAFQKGHVSWVPDKYPPKQRP